MTPKCNISSYPSIILQFFLTKHFELNMSQQQITPTPSSTIRTFCLPANPTQEQIDDFCLHTGARVEVETVNQARVVSVPNPRAKRAISSPAENTNEKTKRTLPLKSGASASAAIETTFQGTVTPEKFKQPELTTNELYKLLVAKLDSSYEILKKEVNVLRNLFKQSSNEVRQLESQKNTQTNDIEFLHRDANCKTLMIFNLPEDPNEKPEQTSLKVTELLQSLQLTGIEIDETYRLGRPKQGTTRPVKLKLLRSNDKKKIMNTKIKLQLNPRTQKIGISPALTKEQRNVTNLLLSYALQEKENNPGIKFKIRNSVLYMDSSGTQSSWKVNAKMEIMQHKP